MFAFFSMLHACNHFSKHSAAMVLAVLTLVCVCVSGCAGLRSFKCPAVRIACRCGACKGGALHRRMHACTHGNSRGQPRMPLPRAVIYWACILYAIACVDETMHSVTSSHKACMARFMLAGMHMLLPVGGRCASTPV